MTSANNLAQFLPTSRAEQATQNEAKRLTGQIDDAVASLADHHDDENLDASADRIERAARDFVHALRELAQERKAASQEQER